MNNDPIQQAEKIVKNLNNSAGQYARPVFRRYPLLFTFLITFGAASIIEGLRFFFEEVKFFRENPFILILIGIAILLFTGTLYKKLEKVD